jgi:hypothetical protein
MLFLRTCVINTEDTLEGFNTQREDVDCLVNTAVLCWDATEWSFLRICHSFRLVQTGRGNCEQIIN